MATAGEDEKKMITLRSSDGEEFELEEAAAKQSVMIGNMIEDGCSEGGIPLPNVTGKVLAVILEYCKKHADFDAGKPSGHDGRPATKEEVAAWDADYIDVEQDVLYDVIVASNYLNIKNLLDLGCQRAADVIKGKTPDEIRQWFKITNDFTPEEEEEIRRENSWSFE
ncbi:SKP1-like protein 1A [Phoenix dactylifera]|uniref:SKP1-like protein n=1 Tax=Phoenix dactylifera TaxID=42345 RepID=A0A8B7CV77_PHODC|nr:SKP1-like protein 1A [Phoenix dactylifera]